MKRILFLFVLSLSCCHLSAQTNVINPVLLQKPWSASWISCPNIAQRAYGIYHFRKAFSLDQKPDKFIIHVTADNRYRLFVNGNPVCSGPARGDLYNWYFDTVDIASFLHSGNNVVAALVWNMGEYAPVAQISNQTAFVLQGDTEKEKIINTDPTWKVFHNKAYQPCSLDNGERLHSYMVIGPGDQVDGRSYPWGWELQNYDDQKWLSARTIANPVTVGYGTDNLWTLTPRNIPLMEESLQRIPQVRRTAGITTSAQFLNGKNPLTIPANKTVTILLDQTYNTVAYPELLVSGGKGTSIKMTYAEALFDKNFNKDNRNEIEGKNIIGNYDIFEPDGGEKRLFRPLWFRTYRYLQLDITTKDQPLVIEDLYGKYTGYPFQPKASFTSNDKSLQEIWDVGWRTARLCAGETYFDCPYYEQLQYEADTRIQSLISLYVTGDDRLMRKSILNFYQSRVPEGLTQGRYPSNRLQVIPPFSLFWVSMVHDYWMYRNDEAFVAQFLTPITGVLDWYEKNIDQNKKMLGPMKWWNFVDWNTAFPGGIPDGANNGNSSVITLQYVYTLQQAAQLFEHFNRKQEATHYRELAEELRASTYKLCFDTTKGEMANTPEKTTFSQHASIMGILANAIPEKDTKAVLKKVLYDKSLSQATFYYRFYLTLAMKKAGLADLYYSQLTPWRDMLKMGLTTFAENPDPARSDCHAWSASPDYDFLATICGIMPDAPGFKKVVISPALGELTKIKGVMPHPDGMITVSLQRKEKDGGIEGEVILPETVSGKFIWKGKELQLKSGKQKIDL